MHDSTNYIIGKVVGISEPKMVGEKTEFIDLTLETGAKYKSHPAIQFKNMFMKKLDGISVGHTVCVGFKLEGYVNESTGNNFTKAVGMSVNVLEAIKEEPIGRDMQPEPDNDFGQNPPPASMNNDGDLPF